ncbi:MAG: response regulator [Verrucomicrobiota bacterium]
MNVLIAEDNPIPQKLLQSHLQKLGYKVNTANDGESAWEQFDENPSRIVVSDWLMPGMDGLELCDKIRNRPNTDYTYFILLTANTDQERNYHYAMERGVDDFLKKPLDRSALGIRLKVADRILQSTSRMQNLENILTICAYTKKINIPDEGWQTIEEFMARHLNIQLSHGIEPDYYDKVLKPQIDELKTRKYPSQ